MTIYVPGLRGTGDWGTDERPKNFRETILWLEPNGTAPLTALMAKMASESVDDPEYNWWEETQDIVRVQLATAVADGVDATFDLWGQGLGSDVAGLGGSTGGQSLVPGDLLRVEEANGAFTSTVEIVTVVTVTSDVAITVSRGSAGTTAAAIADNAFLTKIGNAFEEGTGAPDSVSKNPTKYNNFTQIFKTTAQLTNTALKTRVRTGDPMKNEKRRKMFDHARDLEYAYLFGVASEATGAGGKPIRTTGGILSFLTSNTLAFSGGGTPFTEDNFIDAVSPVFDYTGEGGSNMRLCFAGNGALTNLNKLARDSSSTRINFEGTVKTFGMELQKWVLPQGELLIRTHPLFNVHPLYRNSMVGVNPKGIRDRVLRATRFKDNVQANDDDFQKGEWLTESGLELHHEQTHFYLSNMQ